MRLQEQRVLDKQYEFKDHTSEQQTVRLAEAIIKHINRTSNMFRTINEHQQSL